MRFIVDECTGPRVAKWLREQDHHVFSVYDDARGMDDESILQKANLENYMLITNDKDFGELIFRMNRPHKGVVLLRLENERAINKIAVLQRVLTSFSEKLTNNFIVVTESTIRIAGKAIDNQENNSV